jgi:aminopeptidase YwaD
MNKIALAAILLLPLPAVLTADKREIPFWPDAVPEAIHAHVDGLTPLETVRQLGRFHRVHGSPGFAAAAEFVKGRLLQYGLSDATVEHLPADGETRYAHFPSYWGWNPQEASIEETSPQAHPIASFPGLPVALADYSQDADVSAALVDVGAGTTAKDYEGKDIRGHIVLASGPLPVVHRLACKDRGAVGFLSDFPNQTTAWSGDDRDLVRWGHLDAYETKNTFAFMLSKRQSESFRQRLAKGEAIVLKAHVRAKMVKASYDLVTATIPGASKDEVLLTAHLCHQSAGANDNASGSAVILEVARALMLAVRDGSLKTPRKTIRFLWAPEIAGSEAYLISHPELQKRAKAGIHMDMVGGLLSATHGTFHLSRTAESRPHFVNAIAQAWFDDVIARSEHYAERGGDPYAGLAWPPGTREVFLGDVRQLEMGSDHEVFEESSFAIPMVYFHDWPDVTIHTNKDQPENLDPTKLGRVSYLGAGIAWTLASLPDAESESLLALTVSEAQQSVARARLKAVLHKGDRDGSLALREALRSAEETLDSLTAAYPGLAESAKSERAAFEVQMPKVTASTPGDPRIPVRSPEVRGPLNIYYYDHLAVVLKAEDQGGPLASNGVLSYEALNLVDGSRTVSDIRDVLTGRYEPVSLADVATYVETLARAHVVEFKGASR